MIDLHCHLLPGVDDGPADPAAAVEQARTHLEAGVDTVVCTPHVSHAYRNTADGIARATDDLRGHLREASAPLSIQAGAEVSLARAVELDDGELARLHLGGGEWLLLEPPIGSEVPRMEQFVASIHGRGHRVLLAHPERCAAFHRSPDLLRVMVEGGAAVQLTAGSLTGQFGRTAQKLARGFVEAGLVHVVASDAHDAHHRPPGLAAPMAAAGLEGLVDWACHDVPAAMLGGQPLPSAPALPRVRRGRFFRR